MKWFIAMALGLGMPATVTAVEYDCKVTRKVDSERVYSSEQLRRGQFSVRIVESSDGSILSRCSFAPSQGQGKVRCDRYAVDRVEFDENVKIKKYYVFRSQFDVQLFPDLFFVENNGRGGVGFGICKVTAP